MCDDALCVHWDESYFCNEPCTCGHPCSRHEWGGYCGLPMGECEAEGCSCGAFVDVPKPPAHPPPPPKSTPARAVGQVWRAKHLRGWAITLDALLMKDGEREIWRYRDGAGVVREGTPHWESYELAP